MMNDTDNTNYVWEQMRWLELEMNNDCDWCFWFEWKKNTLKYA